MNPSSDQPQPTEPLAPQPQMPPVAPTDPTPAATPALGKQKMSRRTKAALWLMIGPTALLILSFVAYAVFNAIIGNMTAPESPSISNGALFADEPAGVETAQSVANVLLFLVGAVSVITWLPGLIIGIILLATKK